MRKTAARVAVLLGIASLSVVPYLASVQFASAYYTRFLIFSHTFLKFALSMASLCCMAYWLFTDWTERKTSGQLEEVWLTAIDGRTMLASLLMGVLRPMFWFMILGPLLWQVISAPIRLRFGWTRAPSPLAALPLAALPLATLLGLALVAFIARKYMSRRLLLCRHPVQCFGSAHLRADHHGRKRPRRPASSGSLRRSGFDRHSGIHKRIIHVNCYHGIYSCY
ncbi:MAG: hypothetical protein NTX50_03500 [Candidatus Sumerlaeota bacterium]|nr:hypothetical protein [Candidatus Sumerlaeota bacterium]